jgi:hypothetical protein
MNVILIYEGVPSKHELPTDATGHSLLALVSKVTHETPDGKVVPITPSALLSTLPTSTFLVKDLGPQVSNYAVPEQRNHDRIIGRNTIL